MDFKTAVERVSSEAELTKDLLWETGRELCDEENPGRDEIRKQATRLAEEVGTKNVEHQTYELDGLRFVNRDGEVEVTGEHDSTLSRVELRELKSFLTSAIAQDRANGFGGVLHDRAADAAEQVDEVKNAEMVFYKDPETFHPQLHMLLYIEGEFDFHVDVEKAIPIKDEVRERVLGEDFDRLRSGVVTLRCVPEDHTLRDREEKIDDPLTEYELLE